METTLDNKKFAKRLQKVMDDHRLTATAFAEKLEVGRATISHLMSGRNKPSLDFIMKVISVFKTIDLQWLIYGINPIINNSSPITQNEVFLQKNDFKKTSQKNVKNFKKLSIKPASIKRIILCLEDGTFESYEM